MVKQHWHYVACCKSHTGVTKVCSKISGKQCWHHVADTEYVNPAGGIRSSIPGVMSAVLQKGLEQLKAVYTEAEQAGITSLGTLMFQDILMLYILPDGIWLQPRVQPNYIC